LLVTTEKDWVKLAGLPAMREPGIPLWRLDVALAFRGEDEARLLKTVRGAIGAAAGSGGGGG
jgi:tetraacyldisaccharide-1-P 4'-kinase